MKVTIDRACFERGCACHDSRIDTDGVEVVELKEALAQPEQEPVAWVVYSSAENDIVWADKGKRLKQNTPLYTTPPQTNAYDNMLKAIDSMRPAARVIKDKPATWWLDEFEKVVRNLKENNT